MEQAVNFLYSAIRSAEDNVRGYDLKSQIVGIGYIFTMGLITTIGALGPEKVPYIPLTIIMSWLIGISPIVFFGMVLYPSRKTAPALGEQHTDIKQLYFSDNSHGSDIGTFLSELKSADIQKELTYELMKLSALRDLKRIRFLRALWVSAASFAVILLSQIYRTLG